MNPDSGGEKIVLQTRSDSSFRKLQTITKLINGDQIVIEPHPTLNSAKFVFSASSLGKMSNEEILEHLKSDDVTDFYRFSKVANGQSTLTNTFVATMTMKIYT